MRKYHLLFLLAASFTGSLNLYADTCPDPQKSTLRWGEIPQPWELSPVSPRGVQEDPTTTFLRAHILVAGYGQGVVCTYRFSHGIYSIWQQARTKIPAPNDYSWIATQGGYGCSESLEQCTFFILR